MEILIELIDYILEVLGSVWEMMLYLPKMNFVLNAIFKH